MLTKSCRAVENSRKVSGHVGDSVVERRLRQEASRDLPIGGAPG